MIKQWSVSNFKSIQEPVTMELAPLTLFVGQNSAGKSTLIQSILMAAQTIQSNVSSRSVILNGRIIRLGAFSDIRSNNSSDENVTIGFELERSKYELDSNNMNARARYYYSSAYQDMMQLVRTSFTFSAGRGADGNKELQLQPRIEKGSISYRAVDVDYNQDFEFRRLNDSLGATLARLNVAKENVRIPDLSALNFQVNSPNTTQNIRRLYRISGHTQPAGVMLRHFLPISVGAAYDAVEVEVNSIYDRLIDGNTHRYGYETTPLEMSAPLSSTALQQIIIDACLLSSEGLPLFSRNRLVESIEILRNNFALDQLVKVQTSLGAQGRKKLAIQLSEREDEIKKLIRGGRPARREISTFPVSEPILYAADYVTSFFSERLKYLGPLRDEPKAIYPLAGYNDPQDVGYRGEFTAAVLDNNKTAEVTYIPSAQFPFSVKEQIQPVVTNLVVAVGDWLEYLGIASKVATEDKGKLGHEMTISTSENDTFHDLTHVGVGVSQALPIVVLSLLAQTGSSLIFEQPELHLHPRVQTRLADFFMSLVFAGKQCIVETHSEYLVSRLRYLSAVAEDVEISKLIKIYFVEKPNNQSMYKPVTISETGVIKNWPEGFFDETERNSAAIIHAQIVRAKARRNKLLEGNKSE